jgi:hypothetical protein
LQGCSLDEKVWNTRVNAHIGDAIASPCSLCCLAIPCKVLAHSGPVGVVVDHLLGTGRIRRVGSDLVLDGRAAGSYSVKNEIVRLEGEYFYVLRGK